ncbi:hypothetical protein J8L98_24365, partial [Pseudoalteromonas sp. MMG013]|nr:hypothetical protein [Pseudoalteromonas sp. MMG013]
DDIDGLLDETPAEPERVEEASDEFDIDDIDGLLDETPAEPELGEEASEEFDIDDMDGLIDDVEPEQEPATQLLEEENDELDTDDIDGLVDDVEPEQEPATQLLEEENDELDTDDIDGLVDDVEPEQEPATQLLEEANDELDTDDVDGLVDDVEPEQEPVTQLLEEENDELDTDDIDGLIDEVDPEQELATQLLEENDELDADDIDGLVDEVDPEQESATQLESNLASVEEGSEDFHEAIGDELDIEDIDSLLDVAEDELDTQSVEELSNINVDAELSSSLANDHIADDLLDEIDIELQSEAVTESNGIELSESDFDLDELGSLEEADTASLQESAEQADLLQGMLNEEEEIPTAFGNAEPKELQSVDELLNELDDQERNDWDDELADETEVDLGDDPLLEDVDLSESEVFFEPDPVTPSIELESYPELALDTEPAETRLVSSETEQALSEALQGNDLVESSLDGDLDDEHDDTHDLSFADEEHDTIEEPYDSDNTSLSDIETLPEFNEKDALESMGDEPEELSSSEFDALLDEARDEEPVTIADELEGDIAGSVEPEPDLAQALESESDDISDDASAEAHHEALDDTLGEFDEQAAMDAMADEPASDVVGTVEPEPD